jgi:glyoxylase-like metal-dependent hydrolase (beta-lactamase superfamily II)
MIQNLSLRLGLRILFSLCLFSGLALGVGQLYAQTVGSYTSPARTFTTASYWIEGPDGLVMVDTQFLPKEGLLALQQAEQASGKRVTHALVLHPNPDKFNGTAALQARGVKVFTSQAVLAAIPGVHTIRTSWFANEYKPDYPQAAARPESFGAQTQSVQWAGVPLTLHVLGAGCSAAHVVLQAGDAVFVGDLVNPENHAWLELGTIDAWLARLEEIKALAPRRVYPGRGQPGGPELLEKQATYLRFVQQLVRSAEPSGSLGWWRKLQLQQRIEASYPSLGYPGFMRDGLAAVWAEEAALRAKATR